MENRIASNVLSQNMGFLTRHLVLSPTVLKKLTDTGLISHSIERQLAFKDTDEQIPFLIDSFTSGGLFALKKFLAVLRETGHSWIVDVLLNTQALSYEEIASVKGPTYGQGLAPSDDRLRGLTPEHARMRLTSDNLNGPGITNDDRLRVMEDRYRTDNQGIGLVDYHLDRSLGLEDRGKGFGLGKSGFVDTDIDQYKSYLNPGKIISDNKERFGASGSITRYGGPERTGHYGREGQLQQPLKASAGHYRGQINPGILLNEHRLQRQPQQFGLNTEASGDITGVLVNLHGHFKSQREVNEETMKVLKQEEDAIKELLAQNTKDQVKVKRNQYALGDIDRRLEEINVRNNDVHDLNTQSHLSRYRLQQLNLIPWSSNK